MSRGTEIRVGLTVLGAIAVLIVGVVWLKEISLSQNTQVWKVRFPQTGGLAASDEVLVNGIRKGQVKSMKLDGDHVMIELELDRDIRLTHDSRVAIRSVGMMGERIIAVDFKTTGAAYRTDEVIPGVYEMGLSEVMGELGTTVTAVSNISAQLEKVSRMLGQDGRLEGTVQNFSKTSEDLRLAVSENRALLNETLQNVASASRTARALTTGREAQLAGTLDKFASAAEKMDNLAGRLDSLRAVLQSTAGRVDRGEGTLGKLVGEDQLYRELNGSVAELRGLIADIKKNPKKYFKVSVF